MNQFFKQWREAAYTSLGFLWMVLWAFFRCYITSSSIQIFITEKRMQEAMGNKGGKSVLLGTFLGFISTSCSFSALATSKSLFQKGASFISSIAFLFAPTNLVIELGIIISIFLGWQFILGEYVGGVLFILFSWLLIRILNPQSLKKNSRDRVNESKHEDQYPIQKPINKKLKFSENWAKVGKQYAMEWKMVWKDVTIGITISGIVTAFVPDSFLGIAFLGDADIALRYALLIIGTLQLLAILIAKQLLNQQTKLENENI